MNSSMSPRAKALLPLFLLILVGAGYFRLWLSRENDPENAILTIAGGTMGTSYKVLLAPPLGPEPSRIKKVVQAELDRVEALMSTYRNDSEVSIFNARRQKGGIVMSQDTVAVVTAAQQIAEETLGAFDITVRPLVALWGFGAGAKVDSPSDTALASAMQTVGYAHLGLDGRTVSKDRAEIEIDLSAIAKGYGADRAAAVLAERGLVNFMVEVGGEVLVRGQKLAGTPWRIGIEQPSSGARVTRQVVELKRGALATSGDYRNYYEVDGKRISHTIDPRSGRAISHRLASVSVSHSSAMMADGYATAISVLGPQKGYQFAVEKKLAAHLLIREQDGSFRARSTPAFEQLFSLDQ